MIISLIDEKGCVQKHCTIQNTASTPIYIGYQNCLARFQDGLFRVFCLLSVT